MTHVVVEHWFTMTFLHRLHFSNASKCRLWLDRLLDCKRRAHKDIKSLFAFIYRAYRKDEKLSRPWEKDLTPAPDELEGHCENSDFCEAGDVCEPGGVARLLSLKSV